MKQNISTVYPPPPNRTKTTTPYAKTPQKLNGFQRGSLASRKLPPHAFTAFLFCYATSKTFEWHFTGGPMVAQHCVLAGIGYAHVLCRYLVALHRYTFLGFVKH